MPQDLQRMVRKVVLFTFSVAALLVPARADDNLKTINNPGGGQVVYGPLPEAVSLKDAMIITLKNLHGHFGDRPQIGKIFQTPDHESIATFFTLTAKTSGGSKQLTGMVIVSMPKGSKPAAAVLYDDSARFGKTYGPLMAELNEAWHTAAATSAAARGGEQGGSAGHQAPVPPLQPVGFPDNSGSISLPPGWRLTGGASGAAHVAGPHGEEIHLGVIVQNIYDPRNPQARSLMNYMQRGHNQFAAYPMGGDLVEAWIEVQKQYLQQNGKPAFSFKTLSGQKIQPGPYEVAAVSVLGEFNPNDGRPVLLSSVRIGQLKSAGNAGMWAININRESVPQQYAEAEWPTIVAIVNSYRQNGRELQRQANLVIDNIHARAAANDALMNARAAANDSRNAAVEKTWDDNAKYNKSFENYQLDRSVIEETSTGGHATTGYALADTLVKNFPDHFQYVQTPNFIKDVDY